MKIRRLKGSPALRVPREKLRVKSRLFQPGLRTLVAAMRWYHLEAALLSAKRSNWW
jgi:hypothetical protein